MFSSSNIFSGLTQSISDAASSMARDLQESLESAKQHGLVTNAEDGTFFKAWSQSEPGYETPVRVSKRKCYDTSCGKVEFKIGPSPSAEFVQSSADPACLSTPVATSPKKEGSCPTDLDLSLAVLKAATDFAKFDVSLIEINSAVLVGDEVSEDSKNQIMKDGEEIRRSLATSKPSQLQSKEDAYAKAEEINRLSEKLCESVILKETGTSLDSESSTSDLIESRLHAGELMEKSVGLRLSALFQALVRQLRCCSMRHFVRLKLTGFANPVDHQLPPLFDLFLSNGRDCARSHWVASNCTFEMISPSWGQEEGCSCIRDSMLKNKRLDLRLADILPQGNNGQARLRNIKFGVSPEPSSLVNPVVSLASLLQQNEYNFKSRSVSNANTVSAEQRDWLCFNLALSFLHMCGSDWRRVTWYSDDPGAANGIFFLKDPTTQEIVDITKPYLSWRLQEEPMVNSPIQDLDFQLLDFARLLIEIHQWKRLPTPTPQRGYGKPILSKEEVRKHLMSEIHRSMRNSDRYFTMALNACMSGVVQNEAHNQDEPQQIQSYIFKYILEPLHRYLGSPELPGPVHRRMSSIRNAPPDRLNHPPNSTFIYPPRNEPTDKNAASSSKNPFWSKMNTLKSVYTLAPQNSPCSLPVHPWYQQRVRVAIIDSGIDEEDADIAAAMSIDPPRIRQCRNFTSLDPNACQDHIGHGTQVTKLLLETAPDEVEVYIAKVANETRLLRTELHRIAQAIKWAVTEWDVHIISMSLAFSNEDADVNAELNEALSPSSGADPKIIFSAAGNHGIWEHLAWPARKPGVIAVFAADWSGEGTKTTPNPHDNLNFATLGQDIKIRLPGDDNNGSPHDIYVSGSSYATPIAAGIAAHVLESTRHDPKMTPWIKNSLTSHQGMKKVLEAMSKRRGDYDFLHPLEFWCEASKGGSQWGEPGNIHEVIRQLIA